MNLGAFSISLNVKDIKASKDFYEKLGFIEFGGNIDEKWLIMKNDVCMIGLFEGMIEKNTLTFTPGWDENAKELKEFTDVRDIEKNFEGKGLKLTNKAKGEKGPGFITLEDPDGNPILIDQHI